VEVRESPTIRFAPIGVFVGKRSKPNLARATAGSRRSAATDGAARQQCASRR
jgi:hypothetical protein